MKISSVTI